MRKPTDVAIIGAGPYGLSLAAHLNAAGADIRIFGKPLDTWRNHMPRNMLLKSEGLASSLSSPRAGSRLEDYCAKLGLAYQDHDLPVPLEQFNAYATTFQQRFVPELEDVLVTSVTRADGLFEVALSTGETLRARNVVSAVGITAFAHIPPMLSALPACALSHSFDHRDAGQFAGKEVVVLGAGASAIDTAALLDDCGAKVTIVARDGAIRFHSPPDPDAGSLLKTIQKPPTGIGPGWRSFFCVHLPLVFHKLPEALRLRAVRMHLGPAPGWFMRERIQGRIPALLGHHLQGASLKGGRVALEVRGPDGATSLACDHIVAATGYRVNLERLGWLDGALRARIAQVQNTPILADTFESSVAGLYFIGPAAANSFGPLMRFMVGAEFAAPRVAGVLLRNLTRTQAKAA
ncbi:MAG TPA: NAD(P)-binding domain-containing protein [Rhizomicrobium sp.]|nr:NAD(P)-binding domain-containing protein [Rhizomicrobium sp.]